MSNGLDVPKPIAMVLVGLPGSGKSTWCKLHPQKPPVASTDYFIEEYAKQHEISYAKAFKKHQTDAQKKMKAHVDQLIKNRETFIWDQTNLTKKERDAIYKILSPTHEVHFVCFYVPLDVCIERFSKRERDCGDVITEKRIRELAKAADFPQKGDPCDKIVNYFHPKWPKPAKIA